MNVPPSLLSSSVFQLNLYECVMLLGVRSRESCIVKKAESFNHSVLVSI